MRVRRPKSDCVLTYEVTPEPAPIQLSQGSTPATATLRITVTNHRPTPVSLESARFCFPVGSGPDDLTTDPLSGEPQLDDLKKWRFEHDRDHPGTLELSPKTGSGNLKSGETRELGIAHIRVDSAVGTSTLTITERIKNSDENGCGEWPLAKVPAGFTVGDFRPVHILVRSGNPAELKWRGESHPRATYTILHDGEPDDVTNVRYWESLPLHRDTAFALVVELTEGEGTAEYAMTTAVTVARPNLAVRDLTVDGRALLTHMPTEFDLGDDPARTYAAETDGLLVGRLIADEDVPDTEERAPTLSVTVTAAGKAHRTSSVQSRMAERAPGDPGSRLTAVVPRGSTVDIQRAGTTPYTHGLAWIPLGTGELRTD
ncbi:hypothetical protein ACWGCW_13640 [Streptomyces sp. NPDC054933]